MKNVIHSAFSFLLTLMVFVAEAQKNDAPLADNAPKDKVVDIAASRQRHMDSLIAPYIDKAKSTYPQAKERYLKGLPNGEAFFVVTRIFDKDGKFEQVFIRVKKFNNDTVSGTIANDLGIVKEYKTNQLISFKESQIIDWLISRPDGTEEGNFVGKFMDTQ